MRTDSKQPALRHIVFPFVKNLTVFVRIRKLQFSIVCNKTGRNQGNVFQVSYVWVQFENKQTNKQKSVNRFCLCRFSEIQKFYWKSRVADPGITQMSKFILQFISDSGISNTLFRIKKQIFSKVAFWNRLQITVTYWVRSRTEGASQRSGEMFSSKSPVQCVDCDLD